VDQPMHSRREEPDKRPPAHDGHTRAEPDSFDGSGVPALRLSVPTMAAIFIGGAVGTLLRYVFEFHHPVGQGGFPWATLTVNLTGSLAIGLILPLTEHVSQRRPLVRPLFVVGLLGGWTTYSTLAVEATLLAKDGDVVTSLAYLAATLVGGIGLVMIGHEAGKRLVPS
jgi:fluoride exporter